MKSLLYQDAMVRAILREENPKRQTRRICKPQPGMYEFKIGYLEPAFLPPQLWPGYLAVGVFAFNAGSPGLVKGCLLPDDIVYVREAWQWASHGGACGKADDYVVWRATDPDWATMEGRRWRSPLHLSEADARLFLRVVSVRAERLQDISREDAAAEGLRYLDGWYEAEGVGHSHSQDPRDSFHALWTSIHGPESWEQNPWVWRYEFERVEKGAR